MLTLSAYRCFGLALTTDNMKTIENGEWLCDDIIHASQRLMNITDPSVGGLQNPLLTLSMEQCEKEFIHIVSQKSIIG